MLVYIVVIDIFFWFQVVWFGRYRLYYLLVVLVQVKVVFFIILCNRFVV